MVRLLWPFYHHALHTGTMGAPRDPVKQQHFLCSTTVPCTQAQWEHHVILRSSIIFGPEPPEPVERPLFLSWLVGVNPPEPSATVWGSSCALKLAGIISLQAVCPSKL